MFTKDKKILLNKKIKKQLHKKDFIPLIEKENLTDKKKFIRTTNKLFKIHNKSSF